jgi:hypothetical protein
MEPLQPQYGGSGDAFVSEINPAGSALIYSTYLGGSGHDQSNGIAVDTSGNAYITGLTCSDDFPTMNPLQPQYAGSGTLYLCGDAFVAKIRPSGSALVYSTYLGGSEYDQSYAIAVDSAGNAYVSGSTRSADFPTTPGAFETTCAPYCEYGTFVTKLNSSGTALVYSTYFATQLGLGIAVDGAGDAHLTGTPWAFVAELDSTGSAMLYSIPLGLSAKHAAPYSAGAGIAVDSSRGVYITGTTDPNFPVVNALQPVFGGGGYDAFVAKVTFAISTTQLTSSVNPSLSGKPVTFTATVSSPSGGTPTGNVTFAITNVGSVKKTLIDGKVSITTSKLPLGLSTINAYYGGDSNFLKSNAAPLNQFVLAATTTTLTSLPNPSVYSQAVTFTAVVTSSQGAPPDGETVTFKKGTTVLGTGTLSGGSASFTTSTLPAGTDYIKAVYGGDANFLGSKSKAVSQVVNKATTTTALASSLNPSNFGQSVTLTASVTPEFGGAVTGTVTFYDGTTALKTVSLSGGAAKFTTSTLTSGTHSITATYNGSTGFTGSSASLTQTVN